MWITKGTNNIFVKRLHTTTDTHKKYMFFKKKKKSRKVIQILCSEILNYIPGTYFVVPHVKC